MTQNNSATTRMVDVGVGDWRIEVPYRKSANSMDEGPDCVMVADTVAGHRLVQDSKLGANSPTLPVCRGAFDALLSAIRAGELS